MRTLSKSALTIILEHVYAEGSASCIGVDLPFGRFAVRIVAIINKQLPAGPGADTPARPDRHAPTCHSKGACINAVTKRH